MQREESYYFEYNIVALATRRQGNTSHSEERAKKPFSCRKRRGKEGRLAGNGYGKSFAIIQAGSRGRIVNGIILSRVLAWPLLPMSSGPDRRAKRKRRERTASWECEWDNERGSEIGWSQGLHGLLHHDDSKRSSGFHAQCPIDMAVSHKPDTGLDLRYRPRFPRPSLSSYSFSLVALSLLLS